MLPIKDFGIVDDLFIIIEFFFLILTPIDSLTTLDIVDLDIKFNLQVDLPIKLNYLLILVTQPQGDISGWLVFVLPPWGWSTGFIAIPLTEDL